MRDNILCCAPSSSFKTDDVWSVGREWSAVGWNNSKGSKSHSSSVVTLCSCVVRPRNWFAFIITLKRIDRASTSIQSHFACTLSRSNFAKAMQDPWLLSPDFKYNGEKRLRLLRSPDSDETRLEDINKPAVSVCIIASWHLLLCMPSKDSTGNKNVNRKFHMFACSTK